MNSPLAMINQFSPLLEREGMVDDSTRRGVSSKMDRQSQLDMATAIGSWFPLRAKAVGIWPKPCRTGTQPAVVALGKGCGYNETASFPHTRAVQSSFLAVITSSLPPGEGPVYGSDES